MKRYLRNIAVAVVAGACCCGPLTSCVDDDYWNPGPPYGWENYFYDRDLDGAWELVQANGRPVYGYDVNYMDFYGDGRGVYYYYENGYFEQERIKYFCQDTYNGPSRTQINIQYEYGSPSTMYYWFTGSTLWLQWSTDRGPVTYLYRPVDRVPY